jgi:hypothetical protein
VVQEILHQVLQHKEILDLHKLLGLTQLLEVVEVQDLVVQYQPQIKTVVQDHKF